MSGFERSQVRDAVERIMLYYEFSENKNINDEKIKEILFDTNQNQISELCKHICLGETRLSQQIADRLFLQGVTPPQFISALILHFQKLHVVGLSIASGQSIGNAVKQIKPPIFFKEVNAFKTQIQNWNIAKIDRALEILIESDLLTKTKPGLGKSIIGNIVIRLATVAKKQSN
jgi:DNA polymerase-3 subunit delta